MSSAYAVTKKSNGKYLIAIKIIDTINGKSDTYWETFQISSTGTIDWDSGTFGAGIAKTEEAFSQDLNNDGTTGIKISALQTSIYDSVGEKLQKDTDNALYISDPLVSNVIPILDNSGAPVLFDYTDNWPNGSNSSVSHAVEKQRNGSYRLAIKRTEIEKDGDNQTTYTNWQTFTINNEGVLDWSSEKWSSSIQKSEPDFAQDLDGDGNIGISTSGLSSIATDTTGETLKKNAANELFIIQQNGAVIPIQDTSGFQPTFDESFTLEDGTSLLVETYAVESFIQNNKTYYKTNNTFSVIDC